MLYTDLNLNNRTGAGALGTYLLKELSKLTDVKLFRKDLFSFNDKIDEHFFKKMFIHDDEINSIYKNKSHNFDSNFLSFVPYAFPEIKEYENKIKGTETIGLAVFENNLLSKSDLDILNRNYDSIITACKWCEDSLIEAGYKNKLKSITHGIDPLVFNESYSEKEFFKDKFVIFSGGKFEFRKGQDIVIKAIKILQEKYDDVVLVASWFNLWPNSLRTMNASKLIKFVEGEKDYIKMMENILSINGIDLNKVVLINYQSNYLMNRVYRNSDIGLFPNRCEAGTNIVLMEYMACGKPTIASYSSGNKDVIRDDYSLIVKDIKQFPITFGGKDIGQWDEPNLEEVVSHLEWAYHNRDRIKELGKKAGKVMKDEFTWSNIAEQFYKFIYQ